MGEDCEYCKCCYFERKSRHTSIHAIIHVYSRINPTEYPTEEYSRTAVSGEQRKESFLWHHLTAEFLP